MAETLPTDPTPALRPAPSEPASTRPDRWRTARSPWRRRIAQAVSWLVALYLLSLAALWWWQEQLIFLPQPLPANHRFAQGPDVHERWVDVPGARLHALHLRLPQPDGVVFFLHGNAGNLASWFVDVDVYRRLNVDLVMMDYRGYGKSSGRISNQAQLSQDVRAVWDAVAPRYAGLKRVVYGRSLGTGLAAELAADIQPELTVLVSPYQSMRALAAEHYPWVPAATLRYPLPTDEWLPQVQGAVLLVHGQDDTLIAADHSLRLQALAPQARLLLLPGVGHGDVHRSRAYQDSVAQAVREVTAASTPPPVDSTGEPMADGPADDKPELP
jgi:pimeloyl-ACP methyl ester carboxylesterase